MSDQANDTSATGGGADEAQGGPAAKLREGADAALGAVSTAYDGARERASAARDTTVDGIAENPLAAVLGGLALGAIAGALLPRTQKEAELLGPVGGKVVDAAKTAIGAAKEAGLGAFDEAGINRDAARAQVDKLIEVASSAARNAGTAAVKAVREGGAG